MARHRTIWDAYTGRAGEMATLSELLRRYCNVAVPEIDEGEDIFAFVTREPNVTRIQVKTANAEPLKEEGRYTARVSVPLQDLEVMLAVRLYYIFAIRLGDRWTDFVVIDREDLANLHEAVGLGYENAKAGELQLYLSFGPTSLICSDLSLQQYRNAWSRLPSVQAALARAAQTSPPPSQG
jgi:hypothetical protein